MVEKRRQHIDEALELRGADDQRRRQTKYVGTWRVDHEPGCQRNIDHSRRDGLGQDHSLQQAATSYTADQRVVQLHDLRGEMVTECLCLIEKSIPLDHRDYCEPGNGGDRVAAKGAAVAARTEQPGDWLTY